MESSQVGQAGHGPPQSTPSSIPLRRLSLHVALYLHRFASNGLVLLSRQLLESVQFLSWNPKGRQLLHGLHTHSGLHPSSLSLSQTPQSSGQELQFSYIEQNLFPQYSSFLDRLKFSMKGDSITSTFTL